MCCVMLYTVHSDDVHVGLRRLIIIIVVYCSVEFLGVEICLLKPLFGVIM